MSGQPLMIAVSTITAVYGILFGYNLNKIRKFPAILEELAPDTKVLLSPSQEAHVRDNQKKEKISAIVITAIFLVFTILSSAVSDTMSWSLVSVDKDSDLYEYLQIAALISVCWSAFITWRALRSFNHRMNYLTAHYSYPVDSRSPRSVEQELDILRQGPHRFYRDPMSVAFRYLAIAVVLSGQSWFLGVLFFLISIGNEVLVIELDGKWQRYFLVEAYELYMSTTGGQFLCTCFNGIEQRAHKKIQEKFASLAENDGFIGLSDQSQPNIVYVGQGKGAPTKDFAQHQQQASYGSVNVRGTTITIKDSSSDSKL